MTNYSIRNNTIDLCITRANIKITDIIVLVIIN